MRLPAPRATRPRGPRPRHRASRAAPRRAPSQPRALGHAGGQQVAAVDLQPHVAPFGEVVVEPLRTQGASQDEGHLAHATGPFDGLRRRSGSRGREVTRRLDAPPQRRREDRVGTVGEARPRLVIEQARHRIHQVASARAELDQSPLAEQLEAAARRFLEGQLAKLRLHPVGGDGGEVGGADLLLGLRVEPEAVPRGVAGRPERPGGIVRHRGGMQRSQDPRARSSNPPWRSIRSSPASGTAIAFTVKSRRARSSASDAGLTSGRAPGWR